MCLCVCVRQRDCVSETHGAAQSRNVKLEWTPGPRLALIAFLSTSSCCIRVTFPLWGGDVLSFIYLFILFSIPAVFIHAVTSQRWRCKAHFKKCLNTPTGIRERQKETIKFPQPSVLLTHSHLYTHTHTCSFASHSDNASWSPLCLSGCSIIYLLPLSIHLGLPMPFIIPEKPCVR